MFWLRLILDRKNLKNAPNVHIRFPNQQLIAISSRINFDDQRSQATIKAFSELEKKVILFTLHQKIVEVAGGAEFAGKVFIHKLESRAK